MRRPRTVLPGTFLLIGFAAFGMSAPLYAGNTATRCDAGGCVHIHCNGTGDRCYRYADAGRVLPPVDHYSWRSRSTAGLYRVCDSGGDRCYPSLRPHWDYREYYRRLGFHWNAKDY